MDKRGKIRLGMAAGALWALAVVWGGQRVGFGFLPLPMVLPLAGIVPGLILIAMIARLAARRYFDDDLIDGQPHTGPSLIDQQVLTNTLEQSLLALLAWPFVLYTLGAPTVLVISLAFGATRLAFWIGYHRAPPLRAFGFAGTFYTTALALLWSLAAWAL